jgi:hypothetical protein
VIWTTHIFTFITSSGRSCCSTVYSMDGIIISVSNSPAMTTISHADTCHRLACTSACQSETLGYIEGTFHERSPLMSIRFDIP